MSDTVYVALSDRNCNIIYTWFNSTQNKESTIYSTLSLGSSHEYKYEITAKEQEQRVDK